ncbi:MULTISPECIES: sigma-54-dependent Fis family transcriptional regulator [unclassified Fusibacter]|uniref:sigma-54-dependent Fis family transcriptional regulator n=1 Tax=unclassified Fusibacter TaxID=2624464 RepID=UPI00101159F6|nr:MULTISPECIES: sigma 54-interacting transcriptional regulator [unclassified Fusibacter]MCK8061136.1 sigma 54-interacting transcriptional regulator [Fusibacter sp. A2]NPE23328.1 sigma 54-interacting transcriptional regulator [Fusibacter sp. A1]RXV59371.1 AAA family ATPase [Fusibacter sp. A1]
MKDMIARSRARSKSYGIKESLVYSRKIIDGTSLRERIIKNRDLIVAAEPFMNQLYGFVKGSEFFAILTDAEGCILSIIGDDEILQAADELKMVPGAFMDEANIGTNAMGTTLVEHVPVQVSGREHSISAYYRWTCSAAVIRAENGDIIGTLDLTGYIDNVHPHTLGMVVAAVNAIENTMKLTAKTHLIRESAQFIESLLDSIQASIISCDIEGRIKTVNKQALQLFRTNEINFKSKVVTKYIDQFDEILEACRNGMEFQNEEISVLGLSNMSYVNVSAYPIAGEDNQLEAVILVLRDVKKVHKMANEIMGRRAMYTFDQIIGKSKQIKDVIQFGIEISDSKSTVLLTGESGTGKEIFAHSIHNHSNRRNKNFIVLNCASIPRSLIESELFGYEEGSFTGAKRGGNPGKFEIADGGTIFLDEIGEMPLDLQTRLLRVIQEGMVSRIGSNSQFPVDVRIIAATNKDLYEEVNKGNFRLDLYYRLKVLPIHLPTLRERLEDIPLLADHFNQKISESINKNPMDIPETFIHQLTQYDWPGNVREFENIIELMLNTRRIPEFGRFRKTDDETVNLVNSTGENKESEAVYSNVTRLEELEKIHIERILNQTAFNITIAARDLGIGRNTLYRKIEQYGIKV